jgi:hypothetical protein
MARILAKGLIGGLEKNIAIGSSPGRTRISSPSSHRVPRREGWRCGPTASCLCGRRPLYRRGHFRVSKRRRTDPSPSIRNRRRPSGSSSQPIEKSGPRGNGFLLRATQPAARRSGIFEAERILGHGRGSLQQPSGEPGRTVVRDLRENLTKRVSDAWARSALPNFLAGYVGMADGTYALTYESSPSRRSSFAKKNVRDAVKVLPVACPIDWESFPAGIPTIVSIYHSCKISREASRVDS